MPVEVPISGVFSENVPTPYSRPDRLDSIAVIDANYWIDRVLGVGGTGGSLNVALANAALYSIGFGYGLSEVENGTQGPYTNFIDPNVQLINQSNAMAEAGFAENSFRFDPLRYADQRRSYGIFQSLPHDARRLRLCPVVEAGNVWIAEHFESTAVPVSWFANGGRHHG